MKRILIIEDNDDVRKNTAEILQLSGYEVTTASNGKSGVDIAKDNMPDVIICDIMMPELDGYGVLEALNKINTLASIPFIFLTAKSEKADMRKGMTLGADDYLTKPFTELELLDAIESRLKRYEFLKKDFSPTIEDVSKFMNDASKYLELEDLSRECKLIKFKKKDVIFQEGAPANALYFINSGIIKTYKTTENGKEMVISLNDPGQFLGQLSLLSDNGAHIESASAIEEAELYEIPKLNFTTLMHGNKDVANKFVSILSHKLADIQEQLINVAFCTVRQRLAKTLMDIHTKGLLNHEEDPGISISREDLAGLIGTATETAIRILPEFKEEGFVTIDTKHKIIIEDEKAIEHIALFG